MLLVKRLFTFIASISVLIIALSFAYYLVIFLPNKEKTRQEIQNQKDLEKTWQEAKLQDCLTQAHKVDLWNKQCKARGLKEDCSLPSSIVTRVWEYQSKLRNDCFKQYPLD